jgi:Thermostable hemolysin
MLSLISATPMAPPQSAAWRATPDLRVHLAGDPERAAVEQFIRDVFRARYGADVRQFAQVLVSLRNAEGELVAAAGYRGADGTRLFLERYLAAPVQHLLASASAQVPARSDIAEVGHLAASRAGEGRRLVLLLGPHLAQEGYRWVVSTLTSELRHLFLRLGIAPLTLGAADPALLGDDAVHWGSYYDHHPVVLAGPIDPALKALARRGLLA